ncbi:MAG: hypothetical protein WBD07_15000 [Vicinamibacterales bacterium]
MQYHLDPIAASIDSSLRGLSAPMHIRELVINRPTIVAYLQAIPSDKREIALLHALEIGVAELAARRERFSR